MSSSFPEQTSEIPLPPSKDESETTFHSTQDDQVVANVDYGSGTSTAIANGYNPPTAYYNAYTMAAAASLQYMSYPYQVNGVSVSNNFYTSAVVSNFINKNVQNTPKVTSYANENTSKDDYEEEDDEEDDDPTVDKKKKSSKVNNILPIWGNEKTMNLNPLILTNIQNSPYFKVNLYTLKTYHEVIDEIWYQVKHLEPWEKGSRRVGGQTGMCGSVRGVGAGGIVSTPFCILYKLYTLRLTRRQVVGLLKHKDSPYIRALGFLYIRYTQPPEHLWSWYENYLEDKEEVDVKAGGGEKMTIGQFARHLLLKLDWFSTLFPRIPVPIQKDIERKFNDYEKKKRNQKRNDNDGEEDENYVEEDNNNQQVDDCNQRYDDERRSNDRRDDDDHRSRKSDRYKEDRDHRSEYRNSRSSRRSRSNERRRRNYSRSRSRDNRHESRSSRYHQRCH